MIPAELLVRRDALLDELSLLDQKENGLAEIEKHLIAIANIDSGANAPLDLCWDCTEIEDARRANEFERRELEAELRNVKNELARRGIYEDRQ